MNVKRSRSAALREHVQLYARSVVNGVGKSVMRGITVIFTAPADVVDVALIVFFLLLKCQNDTHETHNLQRVI
jgi:hypothetical protein